MIRAWYSNQFDRPDFNVHDMPVGHTDIRRLRQGMLGGQFWSAYVPWWVSISESHRVRRTTTRS